MSNHSSESGDLGTWQENANAREGDEAAQQGLRQQKAADGEGEEQRNKEENGKGSAVTNEGTKQRWCETFRVIVQLSVPARVIRAPQSEQHSYGHKECF